MSKTIAMWCGGGDLRRTLRESSGQQEIEGWLDDGRLFKPQADRAGRIG